MFSKPTTLKISRELENINFMKALKRKPLVVKANTTDKTIFFANAFGYDFSAFQKSIKHTRIEKTLRSSGSTSSRCTYIPQP